jgi:hypothetical protein
MSRNTAMGLGGLAAIVIDYLIVASFVGLLLLKRWIGTGWDFDLITALIIGYAVVGWFYGKRFVRYFSHLDYPKTKTVVIAKPASVVMVSAKSRRHDTR